MKPLDQELVWATDGTGEDFQVVDASYARELISEIHRLRAALEVIALGIPGPRLFATETLSQ